MMNFGFSDLCLVNPETEHLCDDARRMALKASSLLDRTRIFSSLEEALSDCHLALATTRRFGRYRRDFLHPSQAGKELVSLAGRGRVALVFGREDKGLRTAELDLCQRLITIPTHPDFSSMNLAQAVAVCLYETSKALYEDRTRGGNGRNLAAGGLLEEMFSHMKRALLECGFLNHQNPDHIMHTFRRIFGRAGLDAREVRILRGLWRRIERLEEERRRLSGKEGG
jgi:tRNA/rRNA methyltransferase